MNNRFFLPALGIITAYSAYSVYKKITEYKLRGKTVLITGGSHGLGYVLARLCLEEKCNVVICARDEKLLNAAEKNLAGPDASVMAIRCDITRRDEVKNMMKEIGNRFGGVDVLINNAGIIQVGPFEDMTVQDFENALDVHFRAPLYTTLEVLPYMKGKGSGRIINISSIGGKVAIPHLLPYSTSKFALTGFSNGLRTELRKYGIKVITVNPGLMRTGSAGHVITKGQYEKEYATFTTLSILPLLTISAEYAARRIINVIKYGGTDVILSFPAKMLAFFQFFFPNLTGNILSLTNLILPSSTGTKESKTGTELEGMPAFAKNRFEKYERMYNQPESKK